MSVRLRNGGSWYAVPDGNLRIRYGGSWYPARKVYTKIGGVGGGYWYDSGYTGYPAVPGYPAVYAWDYNNIGIYWGGNAGGAAVSSWVVERLDYWGNQTGVWNTGATNNISLPVNWDYAYQFRIYSVAANGLQTGPGGTLYVVIGHPQQDTYGYITRQRAWTSPHWSSFLAGNQWWGMNLDGNHFVDAFHWQNLMLDGSTIVQIAGSGGSARWVSWFMDSTWQDGGGPGGAILGGARIDRVSYFNYDVGFSPGWWGNGNVWGMGPRGAGWAAPGGNQNFMLWCADFCMTGQELYPNYELTNRVYEAGNRASTSGWP